MAQVVLLRGVNVGGHRTFRPTTLVRELKYLDAVNIGAAGTLVIRRPIPQGRLRAELVRRLPFATEIVICPGREILSMVSENRFAAERPRSDVTRFVTFLARRPRQMPAIPMALPASGRWLMRILQRDRRYVFGLYRRHMKVIGYLGSFDRLFGVPTTTRNWNTITAIARVLTDEPRPIASTVKE